MASIDSIETPTHAVALVRHEEHYACGCTTTRVERILLPQADSRHCAAHQGALTKIIHSTEFVPEPVEEAWQLRPQD